MLRLRSAPSAAARRAIVVFCVVQIGQGSFCARIERDDFVAVFFYVRCGHGAIGRNVTTSLARGEGGLLHLVQTGVIVSWGALCIFCALFGSLVVVQVAMLSGRVFRCVG